MQPKFKSQSQMNRLSFLKDGSFAFGSCIKGCVLVLMINKVTFKELAVGTFIFVFDIHFPFRCNNKFRMFRVISPFQFDWSTTLYFKYFRKGILMPCPSMGPKLFWTCPIHFVWVPTVLNGSNSFWFDPHHLGKVQILNIN